MIYDLPWYTIILTFINVMDSRLALKILKMMGKLGLKLILTLTRNL